MLDDLSTGHEHNLAGFRDGIEFVRGSITDPDLLARLMPGTDVVFHQAALASVPRSVADPVASNEVNITGTLRVFLAARDAGVRRVVYAASSSAYGDSEVLPKREDMPARPLSPYAITKYVDELYGKVFSDLYELPTVGLRYFNVFGPRQDPKSQYAAVIPIFISKLMTGEKPTVDGDGEQTRQHFVTTFIEHLEGVDFQRRETVRIRNRYDAQVPVALKQTFAAGRLELALTALASDPEATLGAAYLHQLPLVDLPHRGVFGMQPQPLGFLAPVGRVGSVLRVDTVAGMGSDQAQREARRRGRADSWPSFP